MRQNNYDPQQPKVEDGCRAEGSNHKTNAVVDDNHRKKNERTETAKAVK